MDALGNWMSQKVIPSVKAKGGAIINNAIEAHKEKKAHKDKRTQNNSIEEPKNTQLISENRAKVIHTQEEIDQIIYNMKYAALYIAAGLRELSNTIIEDDGSNPERTLALQAKLNELSSEDVMRTIDFMLEDKNRDMLDQATIQLFEAFKHKQLIVKGESVPILKYLSSVIEE